MNSLKTSIVIDLIDRVSGPARKINASLKKMGVSKGQLDSVSKAASRFGRSIGHVKRETGALTTKMALFSGASLWFVKSQLIDTAAQFEKFRTVLETVEGSSEKAKISMNWVSDFAAKTPYELDAVMESFVRLRAYGLDPTRGLLRTLGDTGSAMGKPIMQAVEAIADAITGENERLKEFGIRAEVSGNRIRYSYTDKAGKQQFKIVDKNNRKMIESTLTAIWNEKYAGAMEKQSRTWVGMMSNLADQWTRFKVNVMDAGLFDWLKGKLGGLLSTLNRMAGDGSLQKLADDVGGKLKEGFIAAWKAGQALWRVMQTLGRVTSWLAGVMGGYENLAIALAGLMAGKFLLSIGMLTTSFISLGKAAIPVAATALKGLIPLLTQASAAGSGLMPLLGKAGLVGAAGVAGYGVGTVINSGVGKGMEWLTDGKYYGKGAIGEWFYDFLHPPKQQSGVAPVGTRQAPTLRTVQTLRPAAVSQPSTPIDVGGKITINIEGDHRTRVTELKSNNRNIDLDVYSGQMMLNY